VQPRWRSKGDRSDEWKGQSPKALVFPVTRRKE
jgi:hypothetical protein